MDTNGNREWTRRKHKRTTDERRFTRIGAVSWSVASLARPTAVGTLEGGLLLI
jgi:hypothetical protein